MQHLIRLLALMPHTGIYHYKKSEHRLNTCIIDKTHHQATVTDRKRRIMSLINALL